MFFFLNNQETPHNEEETRNLCVRQEIEIFPHCITLESIAQLCTIKVQSTTIRDLDPALQVIVASNEN